MVAADARTAITFSLSPGQAHDAPEGRKLLTRLGPQRPGLSLLMDRAYEGNETRQLASALGFMPVVPPLSTRVHPWAYDREMYQRRNEIERLFRRLMGHVALDGTKVRANASKHKAMSYKRMKEKEAQLTAEVAELLRRAQEVDEEEDRRYGKDKRGDELPEELAFREGRLQKIREAMAALEAEAQAAAEQAEVEGKTHPGVPEDKAQRNFTDAESRIMPGPGGRDFQQAYNCQAVVDHAHLVIVAARATNQSSDKQQAVGMIEETISNTGVSAQGSIRRRRLLLGKGSRRALCSGRGPVRRAGADPPRQSGSAGAPRSHTQAPVPQGPDAPEVANQAGPPALRPAHGNGGAGLRPDQGRAGASGSS